MVDNHIVRKVGDERWKRAQESERQVEEDYLIDAGDDWNSWWYEKFDKYNLLSGRTLDNVLEVGCGPNTNMRFILPYIKCNKLWLEDPLIQRYITHGIFGKKSVTSKIRTIVGKGNDYCNCLKLFADTGRKADLSSAPLEELPYRDGQMDLAVCINVLDHVRDYDLCMSELYRVLKKNGILVLGQDLSNDDDFRNCPESYDDVAHPIKVDERVIEESISGRYSKLLYNLLPREEGRNPSAHYTTCVAILEKN
jgi:SAM-dependent methyltransferase